MAARVDEHVVGLEVAVNEAGAVKPLERNCALSGHKAHQRLGQDVLLDKH